MIPLRALWLFALALLLAVGAPLRAQELAAVPTLAGHVTDQAGMLDAEQRARLEAVLADYENKTGSQIAVLTVKTTAPEQIEQFSIRVADAWKLGRKGWTMACCCSWRRAIRPPCGACASRPGAGSRAS